MRHNYKGFRGGDSCCDIEVHRRSDGKHVFIATKVPENRGTSITNYAEHLATAMRKEYRLKPEDVIWIEHYPEAKMPVRARDDRQGPRSMAGNMRTPVSCGRGSRRSRRGAATAKAQVQEMRKVKTK